MLPASTPVDLTWNAPAECPTRDAVVAEVARVLSASHEQRVPVTARADVARDEQGRWHATLSVSTGDARSDRTLDAEICPAIASATAVIVALAVEGGMPEPASPATPAPSKTAPVAPTFAPQRASQLLVGAAAVVDAGTLPSPAPGVEGTLGWGYSWSTWRVRAIATGDVFLSQDTSPLGSGEAAGESGHFELFAAVARACASVVHAAFEVGPCLGAGIDIMSGTGSATGPAQPARRTGVWATAVGSLLASWSFSRQVAIVLRGEGFYAPWPPDFVVTSHPSGNHISVHQPGATGARAALGIEARFF
jgi:hypothetical protein